MTRRLAIYLVAILLGTVGLASAKEITGGKRSGEDLTQNEVQRLFGEAEKAELAGDSAKRETLLHEILTIDPASKLARWHLGQVEVDGKWQSVADVQQQTAADPRFAEYYGLRNQYGDTAAGHLALARWCKRQGLSQEAAFHWAAVLGYQPNHEEALRQLGKQWYRGRLVTYDERAKLQQETKQARKAGKRWATKLAAWERVLKGDETLERYETLKEIRAIDDPNAIAELETATLPNKWADERDVERALTIGLAFVDALAKMEKQAATNSLLRHAVWAPSEEVRYAACSALKQRSFYGYVPQLLDALSTPIESSFRITTNRDGSVYYDHELFRQGPIFNVLIDSQLVVRQVDQQGVNRGIGFNQFGRVQSIAVNKESDVSVAGKKARVAAKSQSRFAQSAIQTEQLLAQSNQNLAEHNARIADVLERTTGEDYGASPRDWWDWWLDYNEYYSPEKGKTYEYTYYDSDHYYYRRPSDYTYSDPVYVPPPPGSRPLSCFAAGTPVWTKSGQRPIEKLQIGDFVLSQDVNSGELCFQPIIGRTLRPPSEILKLGYEGELLKTTLGHPLWVAGEGWQMAKEIEAGEVLHTVGGPVAVSAIEPDGEEQAYNLVVANTSSYFVGEKGILVHDNTPRPPTRMRVPGLVASGN